MGFYVNSPNWEYRVQTMGGSNPATEITPEHWYSGMLSAIPQGVAGGLGAVGKFLHDAPGYIADFVLDAEGIGGNYAERAQAPTEGNKTLQAIQEWARIDPRTSGVGAQVVGATTRGLAIASLGSVAGGPAGAAALLGTTEGYSDFMESTHQGLDADTALKKALLTGGSAAAGAFLPMKVGKGASASLASLALEAEVAGNAALASSYLTVSKAAAGMTSLGARLATGATINTGFGAANRFLTSSLLEHAGYPEMAAQYKVLDGQAIVSDIILGAAFGGWGHFEERFAYPGPDKVEAAFEVRKQAQEARGAAGVPADPATANLHNALLERSTMDLVRGSEVNLSPEEARGIVEGTLVDPERVWTYSEWMAANKEANGLMGDPSDPVLLPDRQPRSILDAVMDREPGAAPEAGPPKPTGTAPEGPTLDVYKTEQMRQMAVDHPDLEVTLDDGRTVKMSEFPDIAAEQMGQAKEHSKLFDVAVGCFLRSL